MIRSVPADLHLHTTASDGSWNACELVARARGLGLTVIAITDHDTVDAFHCLKMGQPTNLEVITGIEFSTEFENHEVHILGYGIDVANQELLATLQQLRVEREIRAETMVERLKKLGCQIAYSRVQQLAGHGTIGRVHIAQALIESGYIKSIKEGFSRYLEMNGPAYVPRRKLSVSKAIDLITASGGIPVLAHPVLVGNDDLIGVLIDMGLLGLEVVHSSHTPEQMMRYRQMAEELCLVPTGGSDCHGPKDHEEPLIGKYVIPDGWVGKLKELLSET